MGSKPKLKPCQKRTQSLIKIKKNEINNPDKMERLHYFWNIIFRNSLQPNAKLRLKKFIFHPHQ